MAKQKKKNKKKTSPAELTPAGEVKAKLKAFNYKKALIIAITTLAAFIVYEALITVRFLPIGGIPVIMPVYFIISGVLATVIFFLNRGVSAKPVTPDMLAGLGTEEEIEAACVKINRQKAFAKKLMMVLLPFVLSVLFDIIYLFYGDLFLSLFSSLIGGIG